MTKEWEALLTDLQKARIDENAKIAKESVTVNENT